MEILFRFLLENNGRKVEREELVSALAGSVLRDNVLAYVMTALADPSCFARSFLYSARHQLGFDKFVVFESGGYFNRRVRLHFWDAIEPSPVDVHDHAYSFASKVIVGALEQRSFMEVESGDLYEKLFFQADGRACVPIDSSGQAVKVDRTLTSVLRPGDTYYVSAADLHSAHAVAAPTVTVQVQDVVQPKTVSVYRTLNVYRDQGANFARPLTGGGVRERLQCVAAALAEV